MNSKIEVKTTRLFIKQLKQLYKKYPSIKSDLSQLNAILIKNPRTGTPLGGIAFKIRVAVKSKSGLIENTTVNLLTIYDKSEVSSISKEEILALIENI